MIRPRAAWLWPGVWIAMAFAGVPGMNLVGARTRPLGKDERPFPPGGPPFLITMFIIGSRNAAYNQKKQC